MKFLFLVLLLHYVAQRLFPRDHVEKCRNTVS